MPSLDPRILDVSIYKLIGDATDFCLCSSDPGLDWAAFEAAELASKADPAWTLIETLGTGRRAAILPFSDGRFTAAGTATHYVLVDRGSEFVLATKPLTAPQAGLLGQTWGISANLWFTFPGPA